MKREEAKGKKKLYHPPRVEKFGDLRRITGGGAKGGLSQDGHLGPKTAPHGRA